MVLAQQAIQVSQSHSSPCALRYPSKNQQKSTLFQDLGNRALSGERTYIA